MRTKNRGTIIVYVLISMTVLTGFVSLAVDLGRVQLAKTELQRTADAAARYALQGISDGTAIAKAQTSAAENTVDGTPLTLQTGDIETGTWAGGVFTPTSVSPNAVRVTARRTHARGTAVPLMFARMLGPISCDTVATTVAYRSPTAPSSYGLVGVSTISMSGGSKTDSYNSSTGVYGGTNVSAHGDVASNGTVTLTGSTTRINGDVDYGPSDTAPLVSGATRSGTATELPGALSYPNPTAPPAGSYIYYGAVSVGSGNQTMPGGSYYFDSISLTGGVFGFAGPATIYINGPLSMTGGTISAYQNHPANLTIVELSTSSISLGGSIDLIADIYAPRRAFVTTGTPELFGRIVAKTAAMNGGTIHFDTSMPIIGSLNGGGTISIVK